MTSARELVQFDFDADAFVRRAPNPTAIPPGIVADLARIERGQNSIGNIPEREDLRDTYYLFFNATRTNTLRAEFDSLRRIRRLAWALTYSEDSLPRIVDTPELRDALQLIENRFSVSALLGVFDALLKAWDAWGANLLRAFVRTHLADYDGRRRFIQNLRDNLAWYCEENGATRVAMSLLRNQVNLSDVWSYLNLPDYTHGYRYFGAVAEAYVTLNSHLDGESVADIVNFVEMHRDDGTSRAVMSSIIENLGIDAPEDVRQPVQSYVFREWQDPRLGGGDVRWREVSDEARQIFTRWITAEDIRFFFDVVAQACNDRQFAYRKAFWLAYFEHISFCRPVLGRNVHRLLRNNPQALEYYRERQPATLTGGTFDQHAFIIQMGNHTFVEFSTAAACYVYDNTRTPFRLGQSEYSMSDLRNRSQNVYRQSHIGSERDYWQREFAQWIRRELGIEPLRSYRSDNATDAERNGAADEPILSHRLDNVTDGETNSIAELIEGMRNNPTWRANSQELVEIGRPAVPALIRALSDADHKVRFRTINTLNEMGGVAEEAIPKLRELRLIDPMDYIRDRADSVLRRIQRLS